MNKSSKLHMKTDEFKKQGYKVIDWLADYYEHVEEYPVLSQVEPGDIRSKLPEKAPNTGRAHDEILNDMNILMPGITHWQSPNFHAFFPCATSGPAILGDLISTGLGVNGMSWATSPACTELETHILDWLVDMMDLPVKFKSNSKGGGVIQDTASSASLVALLCSREKASNGRTNENGSNGDFIAYTSSQAHSSIEKAVKIAGIGKNNMRMVDVDQNFSMDSSHLRQLIEKDISNGLKPIFVCATVGTTSSTAIDPVNEIGKICKEFGIWLHVDAAMAGPAALCKEYRFINDGLNYADSYNFNPHKWMLTSFDCSIFYVAGRSQLINTMSILPEYLKNKTSTSESVFDLRDWGIPLGRRFRALKLWHVINYYGVSGLQEFIRTHMENTKILRSWIEMEKDFEIVTPTPLTLICFRHTKGNNFTEKLLNTINESGKAYMTHTKLNDQYIIRFSVGQTSTTIDHLKETWNYIVKTSKGMIEA
ncbi:MAG: aminotransferase class V-fold PLP-dependent enzyme [Candidatus Marinimicrobia bacterium]|nr:aminotransferase class V-fold PLP-dependent enzyme [Candidatus Neomarinimicrobiota bacterium]MBT4785166.1 aminotransferase class V-fold PLP-dependent enzyme [Candidatus Neomarinimicrobiota bacterium]